VSGVGIYRRLPTATEGYWRQTKATEDCRRSRPGRAILLCLGVLGPPDWWGPMGRGWRRSTFYQRIRQFTVRSQSGSDMTNCEMGLKFSKYMKSVDWRLNWRDMNTAQKLWDSTVGSHSWRGSTPHPINSNPDTNIVLCVGLFQMQTAKLKSIVYRL